ncbi:MAG: tetratricopeptide repeat protein [Treponema sp.]|nr:tetratricopeptide repeat protein [Treponema sp.]
MQNGNTQKEEDKFSEFVKRNRKGIYIIMGIIIFLFAGTIVYLSLEAGLRKKAIAEAEELNSRYAELHSSLKEEDSAEKVNALLEDLNAFVKGKRGYAGARGWTIIAQIHSGREDWQNAEESWRNAAKTGAKTYLAPAAFFNAAVAAENQGKIDDAIELLEKSVSYKFDFPSAPRAQFSIGRLNEQRGDISAAVSAYRAILTNWPNIETWANLAQSRIIAIEE